MARRLSMAGVPRLGFIGLGRMGTAMVARLVERGVRPAVWSRTPASCEPASALGLTVAASPEALAAAVDVLIMMTDQAGALALTEAPALCAAAAGRHVVLMGTFEAAGLATATSRLRDGGARVVEAPVLGTVAPARAGQLVVLAGGTADDVASVRFAVAPLARALFHLGPLGSGTAMKAAHNLILSNYWQVLGEALALGGSRGLGRRQMLEVIAASPAALAALPVKLPVLTGDDAAVGFPITAMRSELERLLSDQATSGAALPMTALTAARVDRMIAAGWGGRDVAASALFGLSPS